MKGQKGRLLEAVKPRAASAPSLEERLRKADAAMGHAAPEGERTPVTGTPVQGTPVREDVEPPSLTPVVSVTPVQGTPVSVTPVSVTPVTEIPVDERMWLNYPAILNWALDDFLPSLDHNAQAIMLRLLRLTLGFRRRNCLVTTETLARKTRLSEPTITRVVRALRAEGYLEARAVIGGSRRARGIEFVLGEKALPPASAVARVERTAITQTPVRGTGVPKTNMKTLKKKTHEEAPAADAPALYHQKTLETLRAIARSYHGEDVRGRLRQWFETEGRVVDEGMIEEALGHARQ